jgi:hypothetical protein
MALSGCVLLWQDEDPDAFLMDASICGAQSARWSLEAGDDPNKEVISGGWTPTTVLVFSSSADEAPEFCLETLRAFIEYDADFSRPNPFGDPLLAGAIAAGHSDEFLILLAEAGGEVCGEYSDWFQRNYGSANPDDLLEDRYLPFPEAVQVAFDQC